MDISVIQICLILLATGVVLHFVPLYTRPDVFFGVTVAPEHRRTNPARQLLRHYRIALWCLTAAGVAAAIAFGRASVVLVAYLASICGTLVIAHRSTVTHKANPTTVIRFDLTVPPERIPGGLLAVLLPFVFLLGLGVWAASGTGIATPSAVSLRLASTGFLCLVLTTAALGVLHWSRRISTSEPGAVSERRFRRRILLCVLASEYFLVVLAALSVFQVPRFVMLAFRAAFAAAFVVYLVTLIRAGQGGTGASSAPREGAIGDRTPDDCWKGGLIYFNRKDSAIFIEKRMGIGYTLNFGNPWSWVFLGALFVFPSVLYLTQSAKNNRAHNYAGPSAGTEASLRRYIDSLESGHPNYSEMSPILATAVKQQLPRIMTTIQEVGEFKSLAYKGVDRNGADVYDAMFEHGQLEWHIAPLAVDGKVVSRNFRERSD
jgi:uncharacterized membrane protein